MKKRTALDILCDLMRSWHVRDLNQDDFSNDISDLLKIQKKEETK